MEQEPILGLGVMAAALFGGIFLYGVLVRMAYPMRVTLFERARDLLDRPGCTKEERDFINHVLDTALSFKAGWMVPRAMIRAMFKKVSGNTTPRSPTVERVIGIIPRYFLSVLIANPVAMLCTIFVFPALIITARVREHEKVKDAFRDAAREVRPRGFRKFAC